MVLREEFTIAWWKMTGCLGDRSLRRCSCARFSSTSGGGHPAYRTVFGPNPADLVGWEDKDEDLLAAQDASLSGQSVQRLKLRAMAQEAALNEVIAATFGGCWRRASSPIARM